MSLSDVKIKTTKLVTVSAGIQHKDDALERLRYSTFKAVSG